MNINQFINQEVEHVKEVLNNDYKNDLTENFINECNEQLEDIIYTHIRDSVTFNLTDKLTGKSYKSMLGSGQNIDYKDLYEILNRLYKYHHISQEFILDFEEFSIEINKNNLSENPENYQIFSLVKKAIGINKFIQVSDFQ